MKAAALNRTDSPGLPDEAEPLSAAINRPCTRALEAVLSFMNYEHHTVGAPASRSRRTPGRSSAPSPGALGSRPSGTSACWSRRPSDSWPQPRDGARPRRRGRPRSRVAVPARAAALNVVGAVEERELLDLEPRVQLPVVPGLVHGADDTDAARPVVELARRRVEALERPGDVAQRVTADGVVRQQLPEVVGRGTRVVRRDHDDDEPREVIKVAKKKATVRSADGETEALAVAARVSRPPHRRLSAIRHDPLVPRHLLRRRPRHFLQAISGERSLSNEVATIPTHRLENDRPTVPAAPPTRETPPASTQRPVHASDQSYPELGAA